MSKLAKNITLSDWNGKPVDFFAYQSKNWLILVFYRGYWCNICRAQLGEINKKLSKIKKAGAKVIAVSGDEPLYASLLSAHLSAKFPILPDPGMKSFRAYGLKTPQNKKDLMPAIIIVSPKHKIAHQYISETPEERPGIDEMLKNLQK